MGMFDFIGDLFGGGGDSKQTTENDIRQLPDYAESTAARGTWLDTLQSWGPDNGYGAIAPNWDDLWNNAREKVQRYFSGGPEGPGVNAKIAANNARRGVSDQPAADVTRQRSGFQQGNMLMDMAVKQAMEKANLAESGRKTWLGSIQNLAGLKPSFQNYGSTTTKETKSNPVGDFMGGMADGSGGSGSFDMNALLELAGMGGGGDSGLGDVTGEEEDGFDWLQAIIGGGRMLAGDYVGGGQQVAGAF